MYLLHYQKHFIHTYHYFIHAYHYVHFLKITSTKWHEICTFSVLYVFEQFLIKCRKFFAALHHFKTNQNSKNSEATGDLPSRFFQHLVYLCLLSSDLDWFLVFSRHPTKNCTDLFRHVKGSLQLMGVPESDQSYGLLIPVMTKLSSWR